MLLVTWDEAFQFLEPVLDEDELHRRSLVARTNGLEDLVIAQLGAGSKWHQSPSPDPLPKRGEGIKERSHHR